MSRYIQGIQSCKPPSDREASLYKTARFNSCTSIRCSRQDDSIAKTVAGVSGAGCLTNVGGACVSTGQTNDRSRCHVTGARHSICIATSTSIGRIVHQPGREQGQITLLAPCFQNSIDSDPSSCSVLPFLFLCLPYSSLTPTPTSAATACILLVCWRL